MVDGFLDGFPSSDLIGLALDTLPGQNVPGVGVRRAVAGLSIAGRIALGDPKGGTGQLEGPHGSVRLSCGTVELVARDEARAERARAWHRLPASLPMGLPVWKGVPWAAESCDYIDGATGEFLADWQEATVRKPRGRIEAWSPKSRANMVRRMASTQWRPMLVNGVAPMVTLTYPGPWTAFAPSRAVVGRHLEAFKEAYRRDFLTAALIGPLPKGSHGRPRVALAPVLGAWKLEYQRRGAPHVHLLLPVPLGFGLGEFRQWVGATWAGIIWSDRGADFLRLLLVLGHDSESASAVYAEHERRSFAAGTGVDFAEGVRCRDPRRIAVYFLGHSLKHKDGKEYQHQLPASYAGRAGRFWGIWGLEDSTEVRYLDVRTWFALREMLTAYALTEGRAAFQSAEYHGGWLAVNDGPSFLANLAHALALSDEGATL
jgi:hypothetical protein